MMVAAVLVMGVVAPAVIAVEATPSGLGLHHTPLQRAIWCSTALDHLRGDMTFALFGDDVTEAGLERGIAYHEERIEALLAEPALASRQARMAVDAVRYATIAELEAPGRDPEHVRVEVASCLVEAKFSDGGGFDFDMWEEHGLE